MKKHIKKHFAMLLSVCLVLGMLVPIPVRGEGEEIYLVLSKETVIKSSKDQTIEMSVRMPVDTEYVGYTYKIVEDGVITKASVTKPDSSKVVAQMISSTDYKEGYVDAGIVTYTIPANTEGTFTVGIQDVELYVSGSETIAFEDIAVTFKVEENSAATPSTDRTVSLSGPATAFAGGAEDTVTYQIDVAGDAYQSAELKLSYNSSLLEFSTENDSETMSAQNGIVTILEYGETQSPSYQVKFKVLGTGTATTTLTSAAFGTSATAVDGDLTAAVITKASVDTVINKAAFAIEKPESITGEATVAYGENYTFSLTAPEPAKYTYTVTATMGGGETAVIENADGTYTIKNVTGDLVITVKQTPKTYNITFVTDTVAANKMPAAGTVTYGQDYSFAIPVETGCTLAVTKATIGTADYTCPAPVNGMVTIPGTAIIGDVEIRIERISAAVTVEGNGAADASYQETAVIGQSYSLTLNKDASCNYTVTAVMNGQSVVLSVSSNDSKYTIATVTGPITFTVQKTINTEIVRVNSYISVDGSAVWLVRNCVSKLSDGVYTYNGTEMVWSEAYGAYCCLVVSVSEPEITVDQISLTKGTPVAIKYSNDVNKSGKLDANDAQLVYDLYNGMYVDFTKVTLEKFLLADTNHDGVVNTTDAAAVIAAVRAQ